MSDEPQRPTTDDRDAWKAYWTAQGMPWRTEPEIDEERQAYLAERRAVQPDIEKGVFPFKDCKLSRADVEWLLATHESGGMRGPVDWYDSKQSQRDGLDLRGADLSNVDLSELPLSILSAGAYLWASTFYRRQDSMLTWLALWRFARELVGRLPAPPIVRTNFEGADFKNADLAGAFLDGAKLRGAHLEGADLTDARLSGADLRYAYLDASTVLDDASLGEQRGDIYDDVSHDSGFALVMGVALAILLRIGISVITNWLFLGLFVGVAVGEIVEIVFYPAFAFAGGRFNAYLTVVEFLALGAFFVGARRIVKNLNRRRAVPGARLADVHWGDANLAIVDWQRVRIIGEEGTARQRRYSDGHPKHWRGRIWEYETAVRTYRQLAVDLRGRGLNEDADAFAYRAQLMQRRVLLRQFKPLRWLGSLMLDIVSGYGYRPLRSLVTYILVVSGFAVAYFALGGAGGHALTWNESLVVSSPPFMGAASLPRPSSRVIRRRRWQPSKRWSACSSRLPSSPPSRRASLPAERRRRRS